ncbi:MAG: hypothetical protein WC061_09755, partial [Melioribacteraceae bacterium]
IGHPMSMDEPLAKILDGTFDSKPYAEKFKAGQAKAMKEMEANKKFAAVAKPVMDAMKEKDYSKAVLECEKLYLSEPALELKIDSYYAAALAKINPEKAIQAAKNAGEKSEDRLSAFLSAFARKDNDMKIYEFTADCITKNIAKDPSDLNAYYMLANVYELMNNNEKCIETLNKFLVVAREQKIPEENLKGIVNKIGKLSEVK